MIVIASPSRVYVTLMISSLLQRDRDIVLEDLAGRAFSGRAASTILSASHSSPITSVPEVSEPSDTTAAQ